VGAELLVVDVVDDDEHGGATSGEHQGREERDAVLAVDHDVVCVPGQSGREQACEGAGVDRPAAAAS